MDPSALTVLAVPGLNGLPPSFSAAPNPSIQVFQARMTAACSSSVSGMPPPLYSSK